MLHFVVLDILTLMTHGISLHSANAVFWNSTHARQGSCRIRTVREAVDERWSGDSMTESFVLDDVEYKLCRYRVTWDEAQVFCSTHKSHLATLDSEEKVSFVVRAIAASGSVSEGYWIGARKYYGGFWMWDSNSRGLDKTISVLGNVPISYPDGEMNDVRCLTIDRAGHVVPIFVPITCDQRRAFVCQRDSDRTYDNKMRMVAAAQIGEEEFRLYSGRRTWAEAVVQCREEGLQIAEVSSVEEARILAVSMLRNRPGIESAWIGGYTRKNEPGTWRWLASGKKIKNNEMRQRNFSESMGNCLLLDRHLCEIPVYVEAKCDRKRDVLCQKPPKKQPSKTPVAVVVDGCPYWIGFYPLEWSEARKSCEATNASLVVLDSPQTISRMMSLMLDSRAELRHIWTNGHRGTEHGRWEWNVNGEAVPAVGKSFMPWCVEDDIHVGEFNCLNLDRENLETPLVYGLSCDQKQPYVCQPHVGTCVDRAISPSTKKFRFESTEATPKGFESVPLFQKNLHTRLGPTGTMPMMIDDYENAPTAEPVRYLMDDSDARPSSQISNSSTRTTSRFALPTLPRFGIGVASAMETTTRSLTTHEIVRNKSIKLFGTSAPSGGSSASLGTKKAMTTRKPSRTKGRKGPRSTVVDSNFTGPVRSTRPTLTSRQTSRIVPKMYSTTKIATISTSLTPDSSLQHRTRKYTRTSQGRPSTEDTKILTKFTKAPKTNEKSRGTFNPSFRIGSFRRITTPLARVQKKMRLSATEPTTPYDAVDEDYYENYEANRTPDNEETATEDEYEEDYETPKDDEFEKKKKSGKKNTEKHGGRSSVSSVARELSKNMQIALMNILTKGIDDKKPEPDGGNVQSMKRLSDDILETTEHTTERQLKMKNNTKIWSLRPYYAFEGPMIVGLSGDSSNTKSEDKIDQAAKGHSFTFINETMSNSSLKNEQPEAPRHRQYRGNNAQEFFNEGNNVPIVISALPPIRANDPSSLAHMGRYIRNKFKAQRQPEEIGGERAVDFYDELREKPGWPDERYGDANYYETIRRLHPRGNSIPTSPVPGQPSNADPKAWQEVFKISWPEDNSTRSKITTFDDGTPEKNFSTSVRTSRSSKEDAEFPDLKIPKLVKEIKMELDQRLLRDYLVALAKKVARSRDVPSEEEDWRDSWKFILGQVAKILDRVNFSVNGELVKVRIVSDDAEADDSGQILRSNKTKNNLTYSLRSRENSADDSEPSDISGTSGLYSDENSTGRSSLESSSERLSQKGSNEVDKFFGNATRRAETPSSYDEKASTDVRSDPQGITPKASVYRNAARSGKGNKLANWYGTRYSNSNNSRILVPALVQPVGISRIYSIQPIMPQLHHRLAFNQIFAKPRPDQRINNASDKSSMLGSEYLPKGTLSRIVAAKYPKRHFPEKILAKTNFLPFRATINGSAGSPKNPKNKSGEGLKDDCERKKLEKRDVGRYGRATIGDRSADEFEREDKNSRNGRNSEKIFAANDSQSANGRGRDEIVKRLDNLTEEPSIVSLRMIMNPREKEPTGKSRQLHDSSEHSDDPRTVELRLKFAGDAKKIVNYLRFRLNDSRSNSLVLTSNDGTRNVSTRMNDKNHRRAMMRKLQELNRIIAMRNDPPLPWKTKSASRRDRKFRTLRISESDEEVASGGGIQVASLLTNLRENDDQLTLYFDLKLGRVATKPIKTRKSRT